MGIVIVGPTGPTGPPGPAGPAGPTGPTGPAGPAGAGAIIPYASGLPMELEDQNGPPALTGIVGFGSSTQVLGSLGGIDLTGSLVFPINMAFSMPEDGTITSIAAFFSSTQSEFSPGATFTVTAQLFSAPPGSNFFLPIAGASVTLPPFVSSISIGETREDLVTGLAIPVVARTRLLMGFLATIEAASGVFSLRGYGSAGVKIE